MTRQFVNDPGTGLERAVRLASRSEMLGTLHTQAAHDFRDSLNAMTINVELLSRTISDGQVEPRERALQERCLDSLRRELKRLAESTGRALEESRPERTGVQRVALDALVDAVIASVHRRAQRQSVTLTFARPPTQLEVMGDADELRLALFNVTINGLEAMENGGELTFALTAEAPEALLAVSDTGAGIPVDIRPRVWDLFFSTKPQGLGLGLHVARSVIASHGGTVALDPPGTGVTFRMRLPLAN